MFCSRFCAVTTISSSGLSASAASAAPSAQQAARVVTTHPWRYIPIDDIPLFSCVQTPRNVLRLRIPPLFSLSLHYFLTALLHHSLPQTPAQRGSFESAGARLL